MSSKPSENTAKRRTAGQTKRILAAIVESSEDGIAAYTPTGVILTWNRGAEAIFGYTAREAIGKHVLELAQVPDKMVNFHREVLEGKVVSQYEGSCRRKDGEVFRVSATGSPIRNSAGEVEAVAVVLRDVSARHEAEEARRAQSRFLANVSHEIRTPVDGVTGMLQLLLLDSGLSEEQRQKIDAAHGSARALLTRIDDILSKEIRDERK